MFDSESQCESLSGCLVDENPGDMELKLARYAAPPMSGKPTTKAA